MNGPIGEEGKRISGPREEDFSMCEKAQRPERRRVLFGDVREKFASVENIICNWEKWGWGGALVSQYGTVSSAEPVGKDPDHKQLGHSRGICAVLYALKREPGGSDVLGITGGFKQESDSDTSERITPAGRTDWRNRRLGRRLCASPVEGDFVNIGGQEREGSWIIVIATASIC